MSKEDYEEPDRTDWEQEEEEPDLPTEDVPDTEDNEADAIGDDGMDD